jgi:putative membrane protein insertion efficiency factor
MNEALIKIIVLYQRYISPYTPPSCRFYPTCSEYTKEALINHGAYKGFILTITRLCRFNPLFEGGVDLVPKEKQKKG